MKIEDFTLEQAGDSIPWRLFTPANATKEFCVFWIQGWSSSMDSHREGVERMVQQTSLVFATLDPAGHGLHSTPMEETTRRQQSEEVIAIYDELVKLGFKKIIVIGGSFGGYLTALLVGKRPVHAAVMRVPANYPDDEFELQYKDTLEKKKDYEAYLANKSADERLVNSMATKAIQNYDGFVYIVEHELDEVVPAKIPKHYYAAAKHGNYLIVPNTKHSPKVMKDPQSHFAYIEHVVISIVKAIQMQETLESE